MVGETTGSEGATMPGDDSASTMDPEVVTQSHEGRLDLSVDLSSLQIFSGSEFALYLRIRNPFSRPIWIRRVTTNLPTSIYLNDGEPSTDNDVDPEPPRPEYIDDGLSRLAALQQRLAQLEKSQLDAEVTRELEQLRSSAAELHEQLFGANGSRDILLARHGYNVVSLSERGQVHIERMADRPLAATVRDSSQLYIESSTKQDDQVMLRGSLPIRVALQPGNDNVWTITLGTKRSLLFLPATYKLNITVLYAFDPPSEQDDEADWQAFSNTVPATVTIRTSLWSVMVGSVIGGVLGATARLLQQGNAPGESLTVASVGGPIVLSTILSIAAAIFAARKSETQSFVSVEDFWGGALIGFLIGYSGTAAFENITRISDSVPNDSPPNS